MKKNMKKKINLAAILFAAAILGACGGNQNQSVDKTTETSVQAESTAEDSAGMEASNIDLADGVYTVDFDTDSSMFKVNESKDGKGVLMVKDGKGTLHISLTSKNIVNLYLGTADVAKEDEDGWLLPTTDTVTYSDGLSEEVYGFDVPVPVIGEEFDLALIGKKGIWYDHKVSVANPVMEESENTDSQETDCVSDEKNTFESADDAGNTSTQSPDITDGTYTCEVTLEGGSGRASIDSPTTVTVKDGHITADIVWSSPNYEYMLVKDVQFDPVQTEGNSKFQIPVTLDEDIAVSALTVAMSQPHLIDYTIHFDSATLVKSK